MTKYEKIQIAKNALNELNDALGLDATFNTAIAAVLVRIAYLEKALEALKEEYAENKTTERTE